MVLGFRWFSMVLPTSKVFYDFLGVYRGFHGKAGLLVSKKQVVWELGMCLPFVCMRPAQSP